MAGQDRTASQGGLFPHEITSQVLVCTLVIMSETGKKKKVKAWQFSTARKILRRDMIAEIVTLKSDPKEVHGMYKDYEDYDVKKFPNYIKSMHLQVQRDRRLAAADVLMYGRDVETIATLRADQVANKDWHRSHACQLLKEDVDNEKHLVMSPKELHASREEYMEWPLTKFRNHLYQRIDALAKRQWRQVKRGILPPAPNSWSGEVGGSESSVANDSGGGDSE